MKRALLILCPLLLLASGCQSLLAPRERLGDWCRREAAQGPYPREVCHRERTISGNDYAFRVRVESPDRLQLDCGAGLVLKVGSPQYAGGWADVALADCDGDGWDDLHFTATLLPEQAPLEAFFLYRRNGWEQYLLSIPQDTPQNAVIQETHHGRRTP